MALRSTTTKHPGSGDMLVKLALHEKHAELACRVAAEDARDPQCRALLDSLGRQYSLFAKSLRALARAVGVTPQNPEAPKSRSSWLFDALTEQRETALLRACEASESETLDAYRCAKEFAWPEAIAAALDRHARVHSAARFGLVARGVHGEPVVLRLARAS